MTALAVPATKAQAASRVTVWDSGSALADNADVAGRAGWKSVPTELFALEADPPKASSDPGYYGREYVFKGDAVVENGNLIAVFRSGRGRVALYSGETGGAAGGSTGGAPAPPRKVAEILPVNGGSGPGAIRRVGIVRNANDEAALEITFAAKDGAEAPAQFAFDRTRILEIRPGAGLKGIRVESAMDYGVAPAFIGDDLIYSPANFPEANTLCVPAENMFLGLLPGEGAALVMTWPDARQPVRLGLGKGPDGRRLLDAVEFDNTGQAIFLAPLTAPGIWHREHLSPSFLEKDVRIDWKRPVEARWKTQLLEADVKTTFAFRESRGHIWRGVPGSYDYPVWFAGSDTFYHLGKKVPPKGESLIYFVESQDTPSGFATPVDILKATLGRPACDAILDFAGRKLRTHHRRGGDGVHRACTCGCTEAIQAFFEKGEEGARKADIGGDLDDMKFFVHCHVERIDEYRRFADETIRYLQAQEKAAPDLKPYLEGLEQTAGRIAREYDLQKENMKSPEHAEDLTRRTLALADSRSTNNLTAYMELLKAWRDMGGSQDYVVAQCHLIARRLAQEAGYGCAADPKAVAVAAEVRSRCRRILRNPDGYEIWANY